MGAIAARITMSWSFSPENIVVFNAERRDGSKPKRYQKNGYEFVSLPGRKLSRIEKFIFSRDVIV
jgi:hypothetical protein